MKPNEQQLVNLAKEAALEVLLHNASGPFKGLPRTAGWGYPEPYTRDLMFSILGVAVTGNNKLLASIRKVLETLALNQSERGHIPSLVHDKDDRGSSDATPLFLLGVGIFRKVANEATFLQAAVDKAFVWMEYQSPSDKFLVGQLPTSDWRDEQWVLGYGLFVNTLHYSCLRLYGKHQRADAVGKAMEKFTVTGGVMHRHVHEGLVVKHKPYYAFWSYKIYSSERFDLLGNCLAILSGIASPNRANEIVSWIEAECEHMRQRGELAVGLPPNFFPYIHPEDRDWRERYSQFNNPGEYHNGGIWPFIAGFYVAALVAAKRYVLAREKLLALTQLVTISSYGTVAFGFNEWIKAQTGKAKGQDWQTWSAALYLYAATCVEQEKTPFFDEMREHPKKKSESEFPMFRSNRSLMNVGKQESG